MSGRKNRVELDDWKPVNLSGFAGQCFWIQHTEFLMSIDEKRLLAPFMNQAGIKTNALRYEGWESRDIGGHSLGHFLSAICYHVSWSKNRNLENKIDCILNHISDCQFKNGDGYVLPVDKNAFTSLKKGILVNSPFSLNGVWVPFYTLHKLMAGLRDAYRLAHRTRALSISVMLADWLNSVLKSLSKNQIQKMLETEHGGMNEVLIDLSVDLQDSSYLDMAEKYFDHLSFTGPLRDGQDELNGLHGNTQIPKVLGLARWYEETQHQTSFKAVHFFWDQVAKHRSYANGGHGESEHFFPLEQFPDRLTPYCCETCNSYNMLKLSKHVFYQTLDSEIMDYVETVLINHLAANIGEKAGEFGYFLSMGGVSMKSFSTPFDSWWCCVGTGLENPTRYAEHVYYERGDELFVNLYMACELNWISAGISLQQTTNYPESETVNLSLTCSRMKQAQIHFRHPRWCHHFQIIVNGEVVFKATQGGAYASVSREWHDGDQITLKLSMDFRHVCLPYQDDTLAAIMYGPVLMASRPLHMSPQAQQMAKMRYSEHLDARGKTDDMAPIAVAESWSDFFNDLHPTLSSSFEWETKRLKPGRWLITPLYRVYDEPYVVYHQLMSQELYSMEIHNLEEQRKHKMILEQATIDQIQPGFQQSEVEHELKEEQTHIEDFNDKKCRTSKGCGFFSYALRIDQLEPCHILIEYWGGVWAKQMFDIFIDEQLLATQELLTNKPGDFFTESYAIPHSWTIGRVQARISFKSRAKGAIGGIFGIKVMLSKVAPAHGFDIKNIVYKND